MHFFKKSAYFKYKCQHIPTNKNPDNKLVQKMQFFKKGFQGMLLHQCTSCLQIFLHLENDEFLL